MTIRIMRVYMLASCLQDVHHIIVADESMSHLQTPATPESSTQMAHTQDPIPKDPLVRTQHLRREIGQVNDIAWTNMGLVEVDALSQQNLVQLVHVITGAKQAFVLPEFDQVMVAHPLVHILMLICYVHLHAVVRWQVLIELVFGD
jgi:hypothetical protein